MQPKYWLMKSEPDVFSIQDLERQKTTRWDGVRNFQARNFMMNDMRVGDRVLFYHSNAEPPGVAGLATVSALAAPDASAWDKKSPYFDPKSPADKPRWFCVEVAFERRFSRVVSLDEIRAEPALGDMLVLRRGMRLSIQPVTRAEFERIVKMAGP